jgi:hypothetical protein
METGTTPMELRADALVAFSEICSDIERLINQFGTKESRMTIGLIYKIILLMINQNLTMKLSL